MKNQTRRGAQGYGMALDLFYCRCYLSPMLPECLMRVRRFFAGRDLVLVAAASSFLGMAGPASAETAAHMPSSSLEALRVWMAQPRDGRPPLTSQSFAKTPLNKSEARSALDLLWQDFTGSIRSAHGAEMEAKVIELNGLKMKFDWLRFGDTNALPPGGRSLFISLHGGGGAPKQVNDSQWANQLKLGKSYRPAEGIYVAPRAPTDTWDLWHQSHIDAFFSRLIENFVAFEQVNPNRVYVMGYSAGGDGVYQVVPRTADRWAAAAMMAGHPNEASALGLRNVPFAIQVGANDAAYKRNSVAAEWGRKLDALQQADPQGYVHFTELYAGKGHWMGLQDRKAVPWMEKFSRDPLPAKVVWFQDDVTHTQLYWLARPKAEVNPGQLLVAERAGQTVTLISTNVETVTVLLNDAMLDFDQPVVIRTGGNTLFSNKATRTIGTLAETLSTRGDRNLAFSATVTVRLPTAAPGQSADSDRWWSPAAESARQRAGANRVNLEAALRNVPLAQREGLQFLVEQMPPQDLTRLTAAYLLTNAALAYEALDAAPWRGAISRDLFLNDVLPYAVLNETRDEWRHKLRTVSLPLIKDCARPGEAALALNRNLFKAVKVRYSTQRNRPDQSPPESMASGMASCTGLSILLVDACRAVGIPARVAGIPMWTSLRGNHTWVEVWDGGWHFLGAAEPDDRGLDHGWFVHYASLAVTDISQHAIYASSFRRTGLVFPIVWAPRVNSVNALNVTARYAANKPVGTTTTNKTVRLLVSVLQAPGGKRVAADVTVSDSGNPAASWNGISRDESADLNSFLPFEVPQEAEYQIRARLGRRTVTQTFQAGSSAQEIVVIELPPAR